MKTAARRFVVVLVLVQLACGALGGLTKWTFGEPDCGTEPTSQSTYELYACVNDGDGSFSLDLDRDQFMVIESTYALPDCEGTSVEAFLPCNDCSSGVMYDCSGEVDNGGHDDNHCEWDPACDAAFETCMNARVDSGCGCYAAKAECVSQTCNPKDVYQECFEMILVDGSLTCGPEECGATSSGHDDLPPNLPDAYWFTGHMSADFEEDGVTFHQEMDVTMYKSGTMRRMDNEAVTYVGDATMTSSEMSITNLFTGVEYELRHDQCVVDVGNADYLMWEYSSTLSDSFFDVWVGTAVYADDGEDEERRAYFTAGTQELARYEWVEDGQSRAVEVVEFFSETPDADVFDLPTSCDSPIRESDSHGDDGECQGCLYQNVFENGECDGEPQEGHMVIPGVCFNHDDGTGSVRFDYNEGENSWSQMGYDEPGCVGSAAYEFGGMCDECVSLGPDNSVMMHCFVGSGDDDDSTGDDDDDSTGDDDDSTGDDDDSTGDDDDSTGDDDDSTGDDDDDSTGDDDDSTGDDDDSTGDDDDDSTGDDDDSTGDDDDSTGDDDDSTGDDDDDSTGDDDDDSTGDDDDSTGDDDDDSTGDDDDDDSNECSEFECGENGVAEPFGVVCVCVCAEGFAGQLCDEVIDELPEGVASQLDFVLGQTVYFHVDADADSTSVINVIVESGSVCVYLRVGAVPDVENGVYDYAECFASDFELSPDLLARRRVSGDWYVAMTGNSQSTSSVVVELSVTRNDGDDDDDDVGPSESPVIPVSDDDDDTTGDDDDDSVDGDDDDDEVDISAAAFVRVQMTLFVGALAFVAALLV